MKTGKNYPHHTAPSPKYRPTMQGPRAHPPDVRPNKLYSHIKTVRPTTNMPPFVPIHVYPILLYLDTPYPYSSFFSVPSQVFSTHLCSLLPSIVGEKSSNPPLFFSDLQNPYLKIPPFFSGEVGFVKDFIFTRDLWVF